ncbi:Glycine--tRNA ligase, partial [Stegodyphus mimosarum]
MIAVSRGVKTIHVEEVIPFVIESSFGILRIMYSIWEHNFRMRTRNAMRTYFALPSVVAPYKCSILPLSDHPDFSPLVTILREKLKKDDVFHHVSNSSESIGRRYTRSDEMSIPFAITIDFDSLKKPFSVTLRERDTMEQIRVPLDQIVP